MIQDIALSQQQESVLLPGTTDEMLIDLWLHDRTKSTKVAYQRDIAHFRVHVPVPLQSLKLVHLHAYVDLLRGEGLAPATVKRHVMVVKSLLTFAQRTGYTRLNVGTMIRLRKSKHTLAERILSYEQVVRIIVMEEHPRNHAILRLLYASGIRVSELCDLHWKDVQPRFHEGTGQITVFGKGDKTRTIILKSGVYEELCSLRNHAPAHAPVFVSRGGGHGQSGNKLHPSQVFRIVEQAALRANVETYQAEQRRTHSGITICTQVMHSRVSPHWLRHAHASHAIERGASMALVQETLGHESIETTAGYTHARPGTSSAQYIDI